MMKKLLIGLLASAAVSVIAADLSWKIEGNINSIDTFILQNKVIDLSRCSGLQLCEGTSTVYTTKDEFNLFILASSSKRIDFKLTVIDDYTDVQLYNKSFGSKLDRRGTLIPGGVYRVKIAETFDWMEMP